MGSNYKHSLADLDTVFAAYVSGGKAIATGYKVAASDLNNRYAPGTTTGTVGFKVSGADLCTLFAPFGGGGGGGSGSVSPTYCATELDGISIDASPPGTGSCGLSLYSNGTWDSDTNAHTSGTWWSAAPATGIGAGYEVQFTVTGPNSGNSTYTNGAATYQPLSATRTVSFSHTAVSNSQQFWTLNVIIRDVATHTVQSNCDVTVLVEVDFS